MGRKRAPKGTHYKAADWDKYVQVKKGIAEYKVDRKASPEDRILYAVGVMPFGYTPNTEGTAKPHKQTTISGAGAKFAVACIDGNQWDVLGIKEGVADVSAGLAGWYPALLTITIVGKNDNGQERTSQLSTRKYRKKKTRSGTMPFGRRTIATPDAVEGSATTGEADRDYKDCLKAILGAVEDPTNPTDSRIASTSSQPELFLPEAKANKWLSELTPVGSITPL